MQKKIRFVAPLLFLAGLSGVLFGGSSSAVAQQGNTNGCEARCQSITRACLRDAERPSDVNACNRFNQRCLAACQDE